MIRTTGIIGAVLIGLTQAPVAAAAEIFALHTDHAGSVIMETDENRNVTWQGQYEPYGLPRQAAPAGPGYTGHVHDAASGLVYMQQRYYDPQVGRFLSVDPMAVNIATAWNFNRYNYAANNPYRYADPDGRAAAACLIPPVMQACIAGAIKALKVTAVVLAAIGVITVSNEIVEEAAEPSPADTSEDARSKIVDGTRPAKGRSGAKGERERDGGREGREEAWGSINAPESSPRPGVRVKELADGGRAETHDSTKSRDYPEGTPTIKIQDADGNVTDTVRFPEYDLWRK